MSTVYEQHAAGATMRAPGAKRFPACVMATAVVPWTERWEFDEALFRHQVSTLLQNGYRNLYLFGTAGEGYAVTDAQIRVIAEAFVDELRRGEAEPMVGVINLSLPVILERIELVRALGVRRFQVSLPGWGELDAGEVRTFFDAVLGRFPDCQFLHYNLLRTKRLVTADEYAAIAADHPNLVATKNSTDSMTRVRDLLERAPMLQHFLGERGFLYGSLIGECGLLISVAAINLAMGLRYFEAGRGRDLETLVSMEGDLANISREFTGFCSPGVRIDGAYDKVLWKLHDPRFPLRLLPPYEGSNADAAERLGGYLRARYPHWAP